LLNMSIIAGLSMSCWIGILSLGVFSQLKPLPFDSVQLVFVPIFLLGLSGAVLAGRSSP